MTPDQNLSPDAILQNLFAKPEEKALESNSVTSMKRAWETFLEGPGASFPSQLHPILRKIFFSGGFAGFSLLSKALFDEKDENDFDSYKTLEQEFTDFFKNPKGD